MIYFLNNIIIIVVEVSPNGSFLKSVSLEGKIKTSSSICHSKGEWSLTGSNERGGKPRAIRQWKDEGMHL